MRAAPCDLVVLQRPYLPTLAHWEFHYEFFGNKTHPSHSIHLPDSQCESHRLSLAVPAHVSWQRHFFMGHTVQCDRNPPTGTAPNSYQLSPSHSDKERNKMAHHIPNGKRGKREQRGVPAEVLRPLEACSQQPCGFHHLCHSGPPYLLGTTGTVPATCYTFRHPRKHFNFFSNQEKTYEIFGLSKWSSK